MRGRQSQWRIPFYASRAGVGGSGLSSLVALLVSSGLLTGSAGAEERTQPIKIGVLTASWGPTPQMVGLRDGLLELGYRENEQFVLGVRFTQGDLTALPAAARELVQYGVDIIFATEDEPSEGGADGDHPHPDCLRRGGRPRRARPDPELRPARRQHHGGDRSAPRAEPEAPGSLPRDHSGPEAGPVPLRCSRCLRRGGGESVPRRRAPPWDRAGGAGGADRGGGAGDPRSDLEGRGGWDPDAAPVSLNIPGFILEAASQQAIPTMFDAAFWVERGGLASYGPDYHETGRQAARLVDKILKGTKPAEIPVEVNPKIEFAINLKVAKALGLTIAPEVLYRADRIIR